jgi:hypothetical protein
MPPEAIYARFRSGGTDAGCTAKTGGQIRPQTAESGGTSGGRSRSPGRRLWAPPAGSSGVRPCLRPSPVTRFPFCHPLIGDNV